MRILKADLQHVNCNFQGTFITLALANNFIWNKNITGQKIYNHQKYYLSLHSSLPFNSYTASSASLWSSNSYNRTTTKSYQQKCKSVTWFQTRQAFSKSYSFLPAVEIFGDKPIWWVHYLQHRTGTQSIVSAMWNQSLIKKQWYGFRIVRIFWLSTTPKILRSVWSIYTVKWTYARFKTWLSFIFSF